MRTYERFSCFYEPEWSCFAERFAPMIDALIREHAGANVSVLDVACGMGTLALALVRCGHTVHGVDRSEKMVERARECSKETPGVSFSVGDMRSLSFDDVFRAATCTFDSLNYLTSAEDVLAMLRSVAATLVDGGLFVFDSNTERMYRTHGDGIFEHEFDGEIFYREFFYDRVAGQATTVFRFDDGAMEVHRQRPYGREELEALLVRAGFRVVEVYSGIAFEPYEEGCDRVVVAAIAEATG
ncbi:class I SAM-dependent methyltransferase [bacterium]|nr:class I SAM-dependent methyltransferase [bacterium]